MEYDRDKVDEMVLALLYLTSSRSEFGVRAWKGLDVNVLDRMYRKGWISDPQEKKPTMSLSEEGARLSEEVFRRTFGREED